MNRREAYERATWKTHLLVLLHDLATMAQLRKIGGWSVECGSHGRHRYEGGLRRNYDYAPPEGSIGVEEAAD